MKDEIELRSIDDYSDMELVKELEFRNYDFLETIDDYDLENECETRGIRIESDMVDYETEFRRLQKLIHEAYMMSIEVNYCPDRLYKFIENNFRFA